MGLFSVSILETCGGKEIAHPPAHPAAPADPSDKAYWVRAIPALHKCQAQVHPDAGKEPGAAPILPHERLGELKHSVIGVGVFVAKRKPRCYDVEFLRYALARGFYR